MTITAKFAGTCAVCGGRIAAGDKIEWSKGKATRHAACPKASATPSAALSETAAKTSRPDLGVELPAGVLLAGAPARRGRGRSRGARRGAKPALQAHATANQLWH
jgi:hypothetical protein